MIKPFSRLAILSVPISLFIAQNVFAFTPGHPMIDQYLYNEHKREALQALLDASNYAHAHHLGRDLSRGYIARRSVEDLRTFRTQQRSQSESQANDTSTTQEQQ